LRGRDPQAKLQDLETSQYWPAEVMAEYQLGRIRDLLFHVYERVPFYRKSFKKAGIVPDEVHTLEDFTAVPILEKDQVRKDHRCFVADNARRLHEVHTSGSTGMPMLYFEGLDAMSVWWANQLRAMLWWGVKVGEPRVRFWGYGSHLAPGWRGRWAAWTRPLRAFLNNHWILSVYDMSPERMDVYWQTIRRVRPSLIRGHTSALYAFARFLEQRGYDASDLGAKVIVPTSEQLYDWQREQMERVFGYKIANEYGATEVGIIGHECPSGQLHLMDESVYVEILPLSDEGQEGFGEIVITQLNNQGAPLIRYRTGDIAKSISTGCACGRTLRVLRDLGGRSYDLLVTPDGRLVHGEFFADILGYAGGVERFQVEQDRLDHLVIRVVKQVAQPINERYLYDRIAQGMSPDIAVQIEYVDAIPQERSGKYRWVISRLSDTI
jgi:phenylacetate-CoA ligase